VAPNQGDGNVLVNMPMSSPRGILDEVVREFPDVGTGCGYVDASAPDLVRAPWAFDVMVMENLFGDTVSDPAGGLFGGMGTGRLRWNRRRRERALPARTNEGQGLWGFRVAVAHMRELRTGS